MFDRLINTSVNDTVNSTILFSLSNHFKPMFHFYTPWKHKTSGFLMFSGGIEMEH